MKNYESLLKNDEELKRWITNLMNINDHFLVNLTPNLKEEASSKLFNISYKELKTLIVATKKYSTSIKQFPKGNDASRSALTIVKSIIGKHVNALNKGVSNLNKMNVGNGAEA